MELPAEKPTPVSASQDAEIRYNREEFRALLEQLITKATILEEPLSLFFLQPVSEQKEQTEQERLSKVVTEQTESNTLIGSLGDDATYGIAIPGRNMVDALQTFATIFNNSPVPLAVGHSIFSIRTDKADSMSDLYDTAKRALSSSKRRGDHKIVTLLRQGQELDSDDLPENIRKNVTSAHT